MATTVSMVSKARNVPPGWRVRFPALACISRRRTSRPSSGNEGTTEKTERTATGLKEALTDVLGGREDIAERVIRHLMTDITSARLQFQLARTAEGLGVLLPSLWKGGERTTDAVMSEAGRRVKDPAFVRAMRRPLEVMCGQHLDNPHRVFTALVGLAVAHVCIHLDVEDGENDEDSENGENGKDQAAKTRPKRQHRAKGGKGGAEVSRS